MARDAISYSLFTVMETSRLLPVIGSLLKTWGWPVVTKIVTADS